jgi:CheY-like chemotaxis protein
MTMNPVVPPRVLVVDDEADIVSFLHGFLIVEGYDVRVATAGSDALAVVPTFRPDVILSDLAMPDMTGDQMLQVLRERGVSVPVIAISARSDLAGPGFFAVLGKPMDLQLGARVVAEAIRSGGLRVGGGSEGEGRRASRSARGQEHQWVDALDVFIAVHRPHGRLDTETTEPTASGYHVTVTCPCGSSVMRWAALSEVGADRGESNRTTAPPFSV